MRKSKFLAIGGGVCLATVYIKLILGIIFGMIGISILSFLIPITKRKK